MEAEEAVYMSRIQKKGNSYYLSLPRPIMRALGLEGGMEVIVKIIKLRKEEDSKKSEYISRMYIEKLVSEGGKKEGKKPKKQKRKASPRASS